MTMKTQSPDTSLDAEAALIELIRKASISKRFNLVRSMTQHTIWANMHCWRESHPKVSEQDAAIHFVSFNYGSMPAEQLQTVLQKREQQWHGEPADLVTVMNPAIAALEQLAIPYYLAGSVASSLHGMQQVAQDVDLVADLHDQQLDPLISLLQRAYVVDEHIAHEALVQRTSFPAIHLASLMKVDVILPKPRPFDEQMRQLLVRYALDEAFPPYPIASAYEMIVFKLDRYYRDEQSRTDGMVDDAEWNDILGMLKVQGPNLDLTVLEHWAKTLNMTDAFVRALADAGLWDQ
jgi:hypothetical protein